MDGLRMSISICASTGYDSEARSDHRNEEHSMAADEVQDGSLQLVRAIEALHHALDSFGDESRACHHVPLRIPIEMERLTARIMRGQAIPLTD
jgi:hypothetical protein